MSRGLDNTYRPLQIGRPHLAGFALALATLVLFVLSPGALARTTRPYEGSIGSFSFYVGITPRGISVDQTNGDVYVIESTETNKVHRFTAAGAAKNFTAGPDAGTNTLTGFPSLSRRESIAVDNSADPLAGDLYVSTYKTEASVQINEVRVFAPSGAKLGTLTGSALPAGKFSEICGVAVDPSDGNLYVASGAKIWRLAPASPSAPIDDSDYTLVGGITTALGGTQECSLAVDAGDVYLVSQGSVNSSLNRFDAAEFAPNAPEVGTGTTITPHVTAVAVDHKTGEVYADQGNRVAVFDQDGASLYEFGAAGYFGTQSIGIAVKSAASGPASKVYVSDSTTAKQVDAFGLPTKVPTYTHDTLAAFGPDGTSASSFATSFDLFSLGFDTAAERLYAISWKASGILGFNASAPPAFPPLGAFDPLAAPVSDRDDGLAVDNTALASAGNLYLASQKTNLLYGFDDAGAPLPGFPVDPAVAPGAPEGSPKNLCGAAVDSAGNVWVSNSATERILRYSSAGAYLSSIDVSAQGEGPCPLALDSADNLYLATRAGVFRYSAASTYTAVTRITGRATGGTPLSIAVDPTSDHLFVTIQEPCGKKCSFESWVDEYDAAGSLIDEYPVNTAGGGPRGLAIDPAAGNTYVAAGPQIRVFGPGYLLPEVRLKPVTSLANTSATLNGTINTQELALSDCHFEYVSELDFFASGFSDLSSGGNVPCDQAPGSIPLDLDEHPVSAPVSGLSPNTIYRFRLLAANAEGVVSAEGSLTTKGPPAVETTGAPVRTATTARLTGRVYPVRAATTYHFEYGSEGPCDSSPCASTPGMPAGSGDEIRLVAEEVEGLSPDTTYHYRVVADNGNPDGPGFGEDMTVTTRATDQLPGQDDRFPGPPGSDRAWELVSMADTSGNPVADAYGFSDNGDRAAYSVAGGTPLSNSGSFFSIYFAQRPPGAHPTSGWAPKLITPARADLDEIGWAGFYGADDLSSVMTSNVPLFDIESLRGPLWRLRPASTPQRLFKPVFPQQFANLDTEKVFPYGTSADGARVAGFLRGGVLDPAYPAATTALNLYDISSGGTPQLLSLMPDGNPSPCGIATPGPGAFGDEAAQDSHWISADGTLVYFPSKGSDCSGLSQLYLRDLDAQQTTLISGPPLSGSSCTASFLKGTADGAFFATSTRLVAEDGEVSCSTGASNDIYRYDLSDGSLDCLTCFAAGLATNVSGSDPSSVAISDDGSRLYFTTFVQLLPGAPPSGTRAIYRLDVGGGELAYVAPGAAIGTSQTTVELTPDGSRLAFQSGSPVLDPLGGTSDNGNTTQAYLYDDRDRSLTCVSCPLDGSAPAPLSGVRSFINSPLRKGDPNYGALAEDGTLAFTTTTSLVNADQNTSTDTKGTSASNVPYVAGTDSYEWRDGRQLLLTDGLTHWEGNTPMVFGISPSGSDIFFYASAQYTLDAIDANQRLYDARIDGGIDFPVAPKPCPLEVCQGTPKGSPEEQEPSSANFSGRGNVAPAPPARCRKGKVRRKGRCVSAKHKKRAHKSKQRTANHDRRAAR